jgi:hypothetical protein
MWYEKVLWLWKSTDIKILMNLHVYATPEYVKVFLEHCLSACMQLYLISTWTIGRILFLFGI